MTTPADELRAAAKRLRGLAEAAATGRRGEPTAHWAFVERTLDSGKRWGSGMLHAVDHLEGDDDRRLGQALIHGGGQPRGAGPSMAAQHGEFIAAMGPAAGILLADWLDSAAEDAQQVGPDPHALAVARQILGGEQP